MTDILDAPRIESVRSGTWTAHMDGMVVNGRRLSGNSSVSDTSEGNPDGKLTVSFDTGASYSACFELPASLRG